MSKTYTNEYFFARIKKHRLTISKITDYKNVRQLFESEDKVIDLTINIAKKGKEHE